MQLSNLMNNLNTLPVLYNISASAANTTTHNSIRTFLNVDSSPIFLLKSTLLATSFTIYGNVLERACHEKR